MFKAAVTEAARWGYMSTSTVLMQLKYITANQLAKNCMISGAAR